MSRPDLAASTRSTGFSVRAWTDSVPMVVISGQVKRETCIWPATICPGCDSSATRGSGHRSHGGSDHQVHRDGDRSSESIRRQLEKAWFSTTNGRPGPCWLDIPVDVQSSMVDETTLEPYDPSADTVKLRDAAKLAGQCREVIARIRRVATPRHHGWLPESDRRRRGHV